MDRPVCDAIKWHGYVCGNWVVEGSARCWWHPADKDRPTVSDFVDFDSLDAEIVEDALRMKPFIQGYRNAGMQEYRGLSQGDVIVEPVFDDEGLNPAERVALRVDFCHPGLDAEKRTEMIAHAAAALNGLPDWRWQPTLDARRRHEAEVRAELPAASEAQIQDGVERLLNGGLNKATVKKYKSLLRAFWAVQIAAGIDPLDLEAGPRALKGWLLAKGTWGDRPDRATYYRTVRSAYRSAVQAEYGTETADRVSRELSQRVTQLKKAHEVLHGLGKSRAKEPFSVDEARRIFDLPDLSAGVLPAKDRALVLALRSPELTTRNLAAPDTTATLHADSVVIETTHYRKRRQTILHTDANEMLCPVVAWTQHLAQVTGAIVRQGVAYPVEMVSSQVASRKIGKWFGSIDALREAPPHQVETALRHVSTKERKMRRNVALTCDLNVFGGRGASARKLRFEHRKVGLEAVEGHRSRSVPLLALLELVAEVTEDDVKMATGSLYEGFDFEGQRMKAVEVHNIYINPKGKAELQNLIVLGGDPRRCPLRVLLLWLHSADLRPLATLKPESPLFTRIGRVMEPLSRAGASGAVKAVAEAIGCDPAQFGAHSGRKTMYLLSVSGGADEGTVAQHGGWTRLPDPAYSGTVQARRANGNRVSKAIHNALSDPQDDQVATSELEALREQVAELTDLLRSMQEHGNTGMQGPASSKVWS